MPSLPVPGALPLTTGSALSSKPRADVRSFSPTNWKLQACDPPVPPGLKHRINQNGADHAATVKINGFDVTSLSLPRPSSVGRMRGVSLGTLADKHCELFGEVRNSRPGVAAVTKAGGIGEKQARVVNKWKRHTLARCERDREFVLDGAASAKRGSGYNSDAGILGGRPTRVPTRPPIPYAPPTAAPSRRLS